MKAAASIAIFGQEMVIQCAGWLAPCSKRSEWLQTWRSELWYVRCEAPAGKDVWVFCAGAFSDALWSRRCCPIEEIFGTASPSGCLVLLGLLASLSFFLTLLLPSAKQILVSSVHSEWTYYLEYSWFQASEYPANPVDQQIVILRETLMFACMVLPAVTSLRLSSGAWPSSLSACLAEIRWAAFFLMKILLILPLIYFSTLNLSHIVASADAGNLFIQMASSIVGFVLSLRWAIEDQRRRCRICLRTVGSPVQFGQRSRTLLDWNLTEYICPQGHGVLQVSESSVGGFPPQRWFLLSEMQEDRECGESAAYPL